MNCNKTKEKKITKTKGNEKAYLMNILRKSAKDNHRIYNSRYINKTFRKQCIKKTLRKISDTLALSNSTFYLAISIIDSLTSKYAFDNEKFQSVSLVCLCLASKLRESLNFSIHPRSVYKWIKGGKNEFQKLEKTVLISFEFDINFITPYDLMFEFMKQKETFSGINNLNQEIFFKIVSKLMYSIALNYESNKFNSLPIALSILMIARNYMGCRVLLPELFTRMTNYSEEKLRLCYNFLCNSLNLKVKPILHF